MPALDNLTPLAAADFPSLTRDGAECLVVVAAGSFVLPAPGRPAAGPLRLCDEQPAPRAADEYWGEPGASSLRYESEAAYTRPLTDVLLHGHAWTAGGRRAATASVAIRVGRLEKRALVFGARVWRRGVAGLSASIPEPFRSMPLRYEQSFGGAAAGAYDARNPVGMGLHASEREAQDRPLPFIEDPAAPIERWSDRPPPCGFGPVARSWQPRLALGGTYDAAWIERRAPLWPADFDERFFQAAPRGLSASPHLRGGEPVVLDGVSPDGPLAFSLPVCRVVAKCAFARRVVRRLMTLDSVYLEPDERRVSLVYRATFVAHRELAGHEATTVRLLEPWENAP
ncbi:DUF2169 domain-containing protein [Sorangium sp. So ce281]|uniref:DUF2169 family type VI secretion system accessory protein n=1 Tax=unclassified Sorangium TaxID=2621164 RepID=UPI003F622098